MMTDPNTAPTPDQDDESVTEKSGAGYGNNAENGGTEKPGENGMNSDQR